MLAKSKINKTVIVSGTETFGESAEPPKVTNITGWREFFMLGDRQKEFTPTYEPNSPAVIVYSSGSTGASKGIVLPNEAFVNLAAQYVIENAYDCQNSKDKKALLIIPLFFSTGINPGLNAALSSRMTVVLSPIFNANTFAEKLMEHCPNLAFASTSFYENLMAFNHEKRDLSFLKYPISGGEALPCDLETRLNDFLKECNSPAKMMKGWRMCEFGSTVTKTMQKDIHQSGTGKPLSHAIVGSFDTDTDEELGYNQRGEICVITPCRMLGYYKNPKATEEFFRKGKDGQIWGCSGDVGYIDEDGNVFIEGRANDYILKWASPITQSLRAK